MRIVDRYIVGTVFRHFAYALAALLAVFSVINFTEELRSTGQAGWDMGDALRFVLLTLPSETYELFPAAALIGAVLAFGRMATDHELVALQAAGVSHWRTARAALMAAGMLAVAAVGLGEMIAAPLSQRAHGERALALSAGRARSTSSGLWLRERGRFVNVGELRPDGSLGEVYVFDFDGRRELQRFVQARTATHSGDEWRLVDLHETRFEQDASEHRRIEAEPWTSTIEPAHIRALWIEPDALSMGELHRTIALLRERGQNAMRHEVAFWRRATAPVYMVAMVLLAMPLVMVSGRAVRVGERVTLAALVGLGFQMFQGMFANFGIVAGLPPVVTAAVPALIAVGATIALFRWQTLRSRA